MSNEICLYHKGILSIFFNMRVCCVFSLESPHRGDSNEYTQHTIFNIINKITLNCPESAPIGFFLGTQERVRNSRGKRVISVRANEVLLYFLYSMGTFSGKQFYFYRFAFPIHRAQLFSEQTLFYNGFSINGSR